MVYFDSDGVAADFIDGVERYIPWAMFKRLSHDDQQAKLEEIYAAEPLFFFNLKPIDNFLAMVSLLESKGERWCILTAIGDAHPDPELVKRCKIEFFNVRLGIGADRIVFVPLSGDKKAYATSDDILVDDYKKNCEEFIECGGHALHLEGSTYTEYDAVSGLQAMLEEVHLEEALI